MPGARGTGDPVADEGDWYAALVAGEHVGEWLETLENPKRAFGRRERACRSLAAKVASDRVYADEATEAGASARLEAALASLSIAGEATQENETLREALSTAKAACIVASTITATIVTKTFGNDVVIRVRELALGNGVGAKLWRAANMLSDKLINNPEWLEGQTILELGAGVGLCGLLASKLGAKKVVLTDFEFALLDSLATAAEDNYNQDETSTGGRCTVARCDWRVEAQEARRDTGGPESSGSSDDDATTPENVDAASKRGGWLPRLGVGEKFTRIIGSDLLYEDMHVATLPFVIQRRLEQNGECLIFGAVRSRALLDAMTKQMKKLGLAVREMSIEKNLGDDWYEGGYVSLRITWEGT